MTYCVTAVDARASTKRRQGPYVPRPYPRGRTVNHRHIIRTSTHRSLRSWTSIFK